MGENIGSWFGDLTDSIGGFFTDLWNNISLFFTDLFESFKEYIEYLFVPTTDFNDGVTEIINEKFAFVESVKISANSIKEMFINLNVSPKFYVDINSPFVKGHICILDMSWYAPFKPYGDLVITGFVYFGFVWRIFSNLPTILSAGSVAYEFFTEPNGVPRSNSGNGKFQKRRWRS